MYIVCTFIEVNINLKFFAYSNFLFCTILQNFTFLYFSQILSPNSSEILPLIGSMQIYFAQYLQNIFAINLFIWECGFIRLLVALHEIKSLIISIIAEPEKDFEKYTAECSYQLNMNIIMISYEFIISKLQVNFNITHLIKLIKSLMFLHTLTKTILQGYESQTWLYFRQIFICLFWLYLQVLWW